MAKPLAIARIDANAIRATRIVLSNRGQYRRQKRQRTGWMWGLGSLFLFPLQLAPVSQYLCGVRFRLFKTSTSGSAWMSGATDGLCRLLVSVFIPSCEVRSSCAFLGGCAKCDGRYHTVETTVIRYRHKELPNSLDSVEPQSAV
jgi:hypothetical protein